MNRLYLLLLMATSLSACERRSDTESTLLKFYGDAYENTGYSVSKTPDGYVIAGQYMEIIRESTPSGTRINSSSKKMGILKTNSEGNLIGEPHIFGDVQEASGTKVITLEDGTAIAAGYVINSVTSEKDIYVVKLDADGKGSSEAIYESKGNQYATDIIKTSEGYLILGTTDVKREPSTEASGNPAGKKDILILRVNVDLELLIETPPDGFTGIGFIGNDEGVAVKQDLSGGYIVVGTTDRSEPPASEHAGTNLILLKVNADGSTTEPKIVGGLKNESASDFEVLSDGYLIAGTVNTSGTDEKCHIWKIPLNIQSTPEIDKDIVLSGTSASFSVNAMCRYRSSSFLLAGHSGTGLSSRMLIFSIDIFGDPVEGRQKIEGGTGTQEAFDVICDDDDNIVSVGRNSYENNSMITFLKFRF